MYVRQLVEFSRISRLRKVIGNTVISLVGQGVTWTSTLLLTIAYGRFLGDVKFGELFFAITFVALFGFPIEAGFNQNFVYLNREIQNIEELNILKAIVEITTHSNQSKVQLKKIASWLDLPNHVTKQHLERLRNGLILQENGPFSNPYYSFTIELVRLWLTHNNWFFSPSTEK